jgi:hypothetical protein
MNEQGRNPQTYIDELQRRANGLLVNYAQQALDDLADLPIATDPRTAAQRAETWGEIIDTLGKITDQLEKVRSSGH